MEALVYTSLLVGTLGIIFFEIFFREPPRIVKLISSLNNGFYGKFCTLLSTIFVVAFAKFHSLFYLRRIRSTIERPTRSFRGTRRLIIFRRKIIHNKVNDFSILNTYFTF
jgi:photosystem II PsbT protein